MALTGHRSWGHWDQPQPLAKFLGKGIAAGKSKRNASGHTSYQKRQKTLDKARTPTVSPPFEITVKRAATSEFCWPTVNLHRGTPTPTKAFASQQLPRGDPTLLALWINPEDPIPSSQDSWRQLWAAGCCGGSRAAPW